MSLVRRVLLSSLLGALAAGTASAQWTYEYADDFSTDKAQYESNRSALFWAADINPLPQPYLCYLGLGAGRGLVFMDYLDRPAELGYCFPAQVTQADKLVKGVLSFDVSFPCNATVSQFPPGELFCSISPDGLAWSTSESLPAGRQEIPVSSPEGAVYVLFTGTRAMIDNLRVSLSAPAATIRVPQNYRTIQQAIDAANHDDIIEVASGTYTGAGNTDIEFRGKRITVRSASGPQSTIIDCGKPTAAAGKRRGVYFHEAEGAGSTLSGFTVRGGRVFGVDIPPDPLRWTSSASHPIGGGIYCEFSSPTIVNCILVDCGAELGGGIGCVGGAPTILNCTIKECFAGGLSASGSTGRGGGLALVGQTNATITGCTIQGNSGYNNSQGGGIYCLQSSALIGGCTIVGNLAPGPLRGGGAYCAGDHTNVTFQNCVFSQNAADAGAGVSAQRFVTAVPWVQAAGPRCRVAIVNCTIAQNRLPSTYSTSAGGVESYGADLAIRNSIVWFNHGTSLMITGAAVAQPVTYSNIQRGYAGTGNFDADPRFASLSSSDYHLQSIFGRYRPQTDRWVVDKVHSPCIDTGEPTVSIGEEPAPNGSRINMGAYGGTRQASKGAAQSIFYVDGKTGRDSNNGLSRTRALATLQKAINVARNGDSILVWPGVYREEITFDHKAITVQSAADAATLTAPNGYAVSFYGAESSNSVLAHFVITGCGEGAIYCDGSSPTLRNLTIVKNMFGIVAYASAAPSISSCIIWDNASGPLFQCAARYSCIDQSNPDPVLGNINANPLFADPLVGDFHVRSRWGRYVPQIGMWVLDGSTSPCIDAGDPADFPRGERMPNGSVINMGAYGGTAFASLSGGPLCQ